MVERIDVSVRCNLEKTRSESHVVTGSRHTNRQADRPAAKLIKINVRVRDSDVNV